MPVLDDIGPDGLADGTVNDLVRDTQRHLNGVHRVELTKLATGMDEDDALAYFSYQTSGIRPGAVLGINDELVYVWSFDGLNATVERGWNGSTPAIHPAGSVVEVEPRFPRADILRSLRDDILSWPQSVYRVVTERLIAGSTSRGISLPASDVIKVLDVYAAPTTFRNNPTRVKFQHLTDQDRSVYPTGHAIVLTGRVDRATRLDVTYAAPMSVADFASDTSLSTIGLTDSMFDIPPLGAAWRLVTMREVQRLDLNAQGQTRTPDAVPAGATARTGAGLKVLRDQRLDEEANRLNQRYAWRMG